MSLLRDVRERESTLELDLAAVLDLYRMLEHYLPGALVSEEEARERALIRVTWRRLLDFAEEGAYKRQLIADARDLRDNVRALSQHWEQSPPMQRNRKLSSTASTLTGAVSAGTVTAAAATAAAVSAALHELSEAKSDLAQRERKEVEHGGHHTRCCKAQ
eukprot:1322-Heterococcus_DN1.PRE.2